jgi:hypothetical protein
LEALFVFVVFKLVELDSQLALRFARDGGVERRRVSSMASTNFSTAH